MPRIGQVVFEKLHRAQLLKNYLFEPDSVRLYYLGKKLDDSTLIDVSDNSGGNSSASLARMFNLLDGPHNNHYKMSRLKMVVANPIM